MFFTVDIEELVIDIYSNNLDGIIEQIEETEIAIDENPFSDFLIVVSFKDYTFATPRVMTTVSSFLQGLRSSSPFVDIKIIPPRDEDTRNYMTRFNFFELNPYCEETPVYPFARRDGNGRFQELMSFDKNTMDEVNTNLIQIIKARVSGSEDFHLAISYPLVELTDNTCCHSEYAKGGHICVQPYNDCVEVAIVDRGIGIAESLKATPEYSEAEDWEALLASVAESVSSKLNDPTRDHQGFGLYALNEIVKQGNGILEIYANGACLKTENGNTTTHSSSYWKGTLIYFRLPIVYNVTQWATIMNRLFIDRGYQIPDHLLDVEEENFF